MGIIKEAIERHFGRKLGHVPSGTVSTPEVKALVQAEPDGSRGRIAAENTAAQMALQQTTKRAMDGTPQAPQGDVVIIGR